MGRAQFSHFRWTNAPWVVLGEGEPMSEPIGQLIDALGVTHDPDEGELISAAVVLVKVIAADGSVSLRVASSDGLSWIERAGMLRCAEVMETSSNSWLDGE